MFDRDRIVNVTLDEQSFVRRNPDVDHERRVAIFDLLQENRFALVDGIAGPFIVHVSVRESRLVFQVRSEDEQEIDSIVLALTPFRRLIREYFLICESYYDAIKSATPSRIEAIDMGRRGLHDEGSKILKERLHGDVEIDFETARRLFTLVYVLHMRG